MRLDDRSAPLGDGEFAALMGPLGPFPENPRLAVATSGGPDSMALALLAHGWVRARGGQVLAITVDHGLRPEAGHEAAQAARQLSARGIAHQVAIWRPDGAAGQARAREARYSLLARVCRASGIATLLTAHHADDQAETLLQRLEHNSGASGLACIRPVSMRRGIRVLRPFLEVEKARLEATCLAAGLDPVRDPTNENSAHERPALRQLLAEQGRAPQRAAALCEAARRAGEASGLIDADAARASLACIRPRAPGYAWLDPERLAALPPLVAERVVGLLVSAIGGGAYHRGEGLESFVGWLADGAAGGQGRTFGRAYARRARDEQGRRSILVCREPSGLPEAPVGLALRPIWDDRFRLDLRPVGLPAGRLAPLGGKLGSEFRSVWGCPADVARVLPGFWEGGELVALPQFSLHDRLENAGNLATFHCVWSSRRTVTANAGGQVLAGRARAGADGMIGWGARG